MLDCRVTSLIGSGALSSKMLLVRFVDKIIIIDDYFSTGKVK